MQFVAVAATGIFLLPAVVFAQQSRDEIIWEKSALPPAPPPHQAGGEAVRVRLPDGRELTLMDTPDKRWWERDEMKGYRRFYYDPEARIYRVTDDAQLSKWPQRARWEKPGKAPAKPLRKGEKPQAPCPPGMPTYGIGTPCE